MTFQFFFTLPAKLKPPGVRRILSTHAVHNIIYTEYNRVARITGLPEVHITRYIYSCSIVLSPLSYACLVYK